MSREIKSQSEIEAVILDRLRSLPGGENITGVGIHPENFGSPNPTFSVGWDENPGDMTPFIDEAHKLAIELSREFDVRPDEDLPDSAHRIAAP